MGAVAGEASVFIAAFGGSSGTVTVRGDGSQFNLGGSLTVGTAFVDGGGSGVDSVSTTGTLEIFSGGLVSVTNNLNVAADDVDAIGVVTVSGMSTLDVGQGLTVGTGAGMGSPPVFFGWLVDRGLVAWVFLFAALAMMLALAAALAANREGARHLAAAE